MRGRSEDEYDGLTEEQVRWIMDPMERAFGIECPFPSTEAAQRAAEANPEPLYEHVREFPAISAKVERDDGMTELHPPVLNALGSSALRPDLAPVKFYGEEDG